MSADWTLGRFYHSCMTVAWADTHALGRAQIYVAGLISLLAVVLQWSLGLLGDSRLLAVCAVLIPFPAVFVAAFVWNLSRAPLLILGRQIGIAQSRIDELEGLNSILSGEVQRLRRRPYNEALRQTVQQKLSRLSEEDIGVLRIAILNGRVSQSSLPRLGLPGDVATNGLRAATAENLLIREENRDSPLLPPRDVHWTISSNFLEPLKDELFPLE